MHKFTFALFFVCGSMATPQTFTITVRICDQTGVARQVLETAEREAGYVARKSGFAIDWINCPQKVAVCSTKLGPKDVALLIVGGSRRQSARTQAEGGEALLDSSHKGIYAMIFYEQVRRETRGGSPVSQGTLLSFVILHELGHLMGLRHGPEGVMIGTWGTHEMQLMARSAFRFSASECHQMQAEIAARASAMPPDPAAVLESDSSIAVQ